MAVNGVSGSGSSGNSTQIKDPTKVGINGLTAEDFLKILVEQLKNQDPTAPVSNEVLLQQVSEIRSLQSDLELSDTLKGLSLNQSLSAGSSFLGKAVNGTGTDNEPLTGVVDRVAVRSGKVFLGVGSKEITIDQVSQVSLNTAS